MTARLSFAAKCSGQRATRRIHIRLLPDQGLLTAPFSRGAAKIIFDRIKRKEPCKICCPATGRSIAAPKGGIAFLSESAY
jgi:hypothetical protein